MNRPNQTEPVSLIKVALDGFQIFYSIYLMPFMQHINLMYVILNNVVQMIIFSYEHRS